MVHGKQLTKQKEAVALNDSLDHSFKMIVTFLHGSGFEFFYPLRSKHI